MTIVSQKLLPSGDVKIPRFLSTRSWLSPWTVLLLGGRFSIILPVVSLALVVVGIVVPGRAGKSSELIVKALDSDWGVLTIPTVKFQINFLI